MTKTYLNTIIATNEAIRPMVQYMRFVKLSKIIQLVITIDTPILYFFKSQVLGLKKESSQNLLLQRLDHSYKTLKETLLNKVYATSHYKDHNFQNTVPPIYSDDSNNS